MTYNELYLLILGSIALISAGTIIFTVDISDKYNMSFSKRRKAPEGQKDTADS